MPVNWSGIPAASFLGWFLRLPLRLLPKASVVRVRTGLNKGMRWIVGSGTHGCWLGTYESDKQQALKQFVKTGMTVFDKAPTPVSIHWLFRGLQVRKARYGRSNPVRGMPNIF